MNLYITPLSIEQYSKDFLKKIGVISEKIQEIDFDEVKNFVAQVIYCYLSGGKAPQGTDEFGQELSMACEENNFSNFCKAVENFLAKNGWNIL